MQTPDITKAQILALVQAVIAVAVAFGVSLTSEQQAAILGLAGAVAIVLPIADAIIRNGRSRIVAEAMRSSSEDQPQA